MELTKNEIKDTLELLEEYKKELKYTVNLCNDNVSAYSQQKMNPHADEKIERSKNTKSQCLNKIETIENIINKLS